MVQPASSRPRSVPIEVARSARAHFQPYYSEPLSDEDGREIAANLLGMISLLKQWKERRDAGLPPTPAFPTRTPSGRRRSSTANQE